MFAAGRRFTPEQAQARAALRVRRAASTSSSTSTQVKPPWASVRQAEPNRGHPVVGLHESFSRDVWYRPVQWQSAPPLRAMYAQPTTSPFHRNAAVSHPGRTLYLDRTGVAQRPASAAAARPKPGAARPGLDVARPQSATRRSPAMQEHPNPIQELAPRALTKELESFGSLGRTGSKGPSNPVAMPSPPVFSGYGSADSDALSAAASTTAPGA